MASAEDQVLLDRAQENDVTVKVLADLTSKYEGEPEIVVALERASKVRKKSHRTPLKDRASAVSELSPSEASLLHEDCLAELPEDDRILQSVEHALFGRKRKKVEKTLQSSQSMSGRQLEKLLDYCRAELPGDRKTEGTIQSLIEERRRSHFSVLESKYEQLSSESTVKEIARLLEEVLMEIGDKDPFTERVRQRLRQREDEVRSPLEDKLDSLSSPENVGVVTAEEVQQLVRQCEDEFAPGDALLVRATRFQTRVANPEASTPVKPEYTSIAIDEGDVTGGIVSQRSRKSRSNNGGTRATEKRRKDKKRNVAGGGFNIGEYLRGIKEDLSGVNDTNMQKLMITVAFLLLLAVTVYTVQLSLKIAPFEEDASGESATAVDTAAAA